MPGALPRDLPGAAEGTREGAAEGTGPRPSHAGWSPPRASGGDVCKAPHRRKGPAPKVWDGGVARWSGDAAFGHVPTTPNPSALVQGVLRLAQGEVLPAGLTDR
jgi:hypothetical protein